MSCCLDVLPLIYYPEDDNQGGVIALPRSRLFHDLIAETPFLECWDPCRLASQRRKAPVSAPDIRRHDVAIQDRNWWNGCPEMKLILSSGSQCLTRFPQSWPDLMIEQKIDGVASWDLHLLTLCPCLSRFDHRFQDGGSPTDWWCVSIVFSKPAWGPLPRQKDDACCRTLA